MLRVGRDEGSRAAASLAALAMLVELFLGLPASLQMAAGGQLVICTTAGLERVPADTRLGKALGLGHPGCILCHGGPGAVLPADPAPEPASPATIGLSPPKLAAMPSLSPAPHRVYASRAPPATTARA